LPMTVVSTFFATDIVKFQDMDTLKGKWSLGAGAWFVGFTAGLMTIVYLTYLAFKFGASLKTFLANALEWLLYAFFEIVEWLWDGLTKIAKRPWHVMIHVVAGICLRDGHEPPSPQLRPVPKPNPPSDQGSPTEDSNERKVSASTHSDFNPDHQQGTADGNLNSNALKSQGNRSDRSLDDIRASSGGSTLPLVKKRSISPDLDKMEKGELSH